MYNNVEFIHNGIGGFLCTCLEQWYGKIHVLRTCVSKIWGNTNFIKCCWVALPWSPRN